MCNYISTQAFAMVSACQKALGTLVSEWPAMATQSTSQSIGGRAMWISRALLSRCSAARVSSERAAFGSCAVSFGCCMLKGCVCTIGSTRAGDGLSIWVKLCMTACCALWYLRQALPPTRVVTYQVFQSDRFGWPALCGFFLFCYWL